MRLTEADKEYLEAYIDKHLAAKSTVKINESISEAISKAVSEAIKPLANEIGSLREILEQTREQNQTLQQKLIEKTDKIKQLEEALVSATKRNVELHGLILEKTDELEGRSRKDNLRISGIEMIPNEDNDKLKAKTIETLSDNGVEIDGTDIFRTHRCGKVHPMNSFKKYINFSNDVPTPIDPNDKTQTAEAIIRFTNWDAWEKVHSLHYKKNLKIRVNTDLTGYRKGLLDSACAYLSDKKLKAYVYSNADNNLILKDVNIGRKYYFSNFNDFKALTDPLIVDASFHEANKSRGRRPNNR